MGSVTGRIPDSGQAGCYSGVEEISCGGSGQDGETLVNPKSYTKLDDNGNELPVAAKTWVMVRDNVTGLIWEVKRNQDGVKDYADPHDADNTYTWYDSNPATNGGNAGTPGDGTDTEDVIGAMNAARFGGHDDWRLPTKNELASLVNLGLAYSRPLIDVGFFPATATGYWASLGMVVDFADGIFGTPLYVRAVRGGQARPPGSLAINDEDTVTDTHTGVMWQRRGNPDAMNWRSAFSYCSSLILSVYEDWRLPGKEELRSLVDYAKPNPSIDREIFPDTASSNYYSYTTYPNSVPFAWSVNLIGLRDDWGMKDYVRAARGGQPLISDHLYIQSPLQASHWATGDTMRITWNTRNIAGNVNISLSRDGGKTFPEVIASGTPNDGFHVWTVSGPASVNCALKLEPVADPSKGTVQSLFDIR